jgi:hypothetical protein
VIAVFSLAIFLIGVRMRLPREQVVEHVEQARAEAEIEERELGAPAA